MKNKSRGLLTNPLFQIHFTVFLWGFTAILGKLISIPTLGMIFLRMSIAGLGFLAMGKTRSSLAKTSRQQIKYMAIIGFFICLHWLCFYQSIKEYNSSSIALVCLGAGPMFVIWIQYFSRIKKSISVLNILISIIAILGMYFISKGSVNYTFHMGSLGAYERAIIFGILASFFSALFILLNSQLSVDLAPEVISFVEMSSGAACLLIYHGLFGNFDFVFEISWNDIFYLLLLSTLCTNIPFLISVYALKKLEPFIVTLTVNLEPIYGLILAALLFQEYKNFNIYFYLGATLILFSVFLPIVSNQWKRRRS